MNINFSARQICSLRMRSVGIGRKVLKIVKHDMVPEIDEVRNKMLNGRLEYLKR